MRRGGQSEATTGAVAIALLMPYLNKFKTIASDTGKEFAAHEPIVRAVGADFYFAQPYASWERGVNENGNGLVRQYVPKNSDFTAITQADLNLLTDRRNHSLRKTLVYQTPNEIFFNLLAVALCC